MDKRRARHITEEDRRRFLELAEKAGLLTPTMTAALKRPTYTRSSEDPAPHQSENE
jgi:hypothetical protein